MQDFAGSCYNLYVKNWMEKINNNILSNPWVTFIISILLAVIAGFVANFLNKNIVASIGLMFGISTKGLELYNSKLNKLNLAKEKLEILKRFAREKINQTRDLLPRKDSGPTISCLASLEFIVTEISKCCSNSQHIEDFRNVKGIISDTKTTFNKAKFDESIEKPYEDVVTSINKIESYLNDL